MAVPRIDDVTEDIETEDAQIRQVEVLDDRELIFAFSNGVSVKVEANRIRACALQYASQIAGPEESLDDGDPD